MVFELCLAEMVLMLATYVANHMMASAMAGTHTSTQARIIKSSCLYTHCRSHILNLSIASSCTEHGICDTIQVINEVYLLSFHNSPKRRRFLELVLDAYISEPHACKNK